MPQFLVLAYDAADADAPKRRQAQQPAHREGLSAMLKAGTLVVAGPLLDDAGGSLGSMMLFDAAGRADIDAWLAREPYKVGNVWGRVEIMPMRITFPPPQ
jgi:uncharacterized protein YciI